MKIKNYIIASLLVFISACSASYQEKILQTEKAFYNNNFESAIPEIRSLAQDSSNKDRLLYLMEAGILFHTKGDYQTSNKVLMQAEDIADTIQKSMSRQALSFILSDEQSNFRGESFEVVLIKFYIALNHVMMGNHDAAKKHFKKVEYELKEMKTVESEYKQNLAARYMNALVSEYLGNYNDARVQYKNIMELGANRKEVLADRYLLALKEGDSDDMARYAEGKSYIKAFDASLNPISYKDGLAEVVILQEAGKAPIKVSRGKLFDDPYFGAALKGAIESTLRSQGQTLPLTSVIAAFSTAENPIPKYQKRPSSFEGESIVYVNGREIGKTIIIDDYSTTATKNFEENYTELVTRNVASLATKMVAATVAAYAAKAAFQVKKNKNGKNRRDEDAMLELAGDIAGGIAGFATGLAMSFTIKPDLRCWHTSPANFQVKRIFLEPGDYNFEFKSTNGSVLKQVNISAEKDRPKFINFRSF